MIDHPYQHLGKNLIKHSGTCPLVGILFAFSKVILFIRRVFWLESNVFRIGMVISCSLDSSTYRWLWIPEMKFHHQKLQSKIKTWRHYTHQEGPGHGTSFPRWLLLLWLSSTCPAHLISCHVWKLDQLPHLFTSRKVWQHSLFSFQSLHLISSLAFC